jgi:hypothetical protein
MNLIRTKQLFLIAGIYDLVLGLAFFLFHRALFAMFDAPPLGHPSYAEFPALLVVTFGAMFLQIGRDPVRYRSMIPYGMALKAAFSGVAIWRLLTIGLPMMWVPIAIIDLAFLGLFAVAWYAAPKLQKDA